MSEIRLHERAAGKKLLPEHRQKNPPIRPATFKKTKNTEKGGIPKPNTTGECDSSLGKGDAYHGAPLPLEKVTATRVQRIKDPNPTKDVQRCYPPKVPALDRSKRRNEVHCAKIHPLKHEKSDLRDRREKEREKICQVHEALKTDLEIHKPPIQRLDLAESNLQCAPAYMQQVANDREMEHEALTSRPQAAERRVVELEMAASAVTAAQKEAEMFFKQLNDVTLQLEEKTRSFNDLEQVNTELQEKLEALWTQRNNMKKRICKFQQALAGREVLKRRLDNLRWIVTAANLERDTFAEDLSIERSAWKEEAQQLTQRVNQLTEEKEQVSRQVLALQNELGELRRKRAESRPPTRPSLAEWQLQAQAYSTQMELKNLKEQLHIQVQENQRLRLQNVEQQEQLRRLEEKAKDQQEIPEIPGFTCVCDPQPEEQLALLQDSLHRVSGEKEGLTSILNSELQELRATCDLHITSNERLSSEKDALQQHLQRQTQLQEQLKQVQAPTNWGDPE
ncbi:PREDICTED: golgin subfamily A member 2-like, partial [Dipodomys ordii]|uniref:Golgin subfamily A member 2-like n=1 Tax=Dipodomys ordii TaxID=10020 RepID=A0A1S3GVY1_DIPOR